MIDVNTVKFESQIGAELLPYLYDHRIKGTAVMPAAAYIEMAFAAVKTLSAERPILHDIHFEQPLILPENSLCTLQLSVSSGPAGAGVFQIASRAEQEMVKTEIPHVSGKVVFNPSDQPARSSEAPSLMEIQARCAEVISPEEHYLDLNRQGFEYGPSFRVINTIWRVDGEALGKMSLPENLIQEEDYYQIHPVLLDGSFQLIRDAIAQGRKDDGIVGNYLPFHIDRVQVYSRPGRLSWGHVRIRNIEGVGADGVIADIRVIREEGQLVLEIEGLELRRSRKTTSQSKEDQALDWLYKIEWKEKTDKAIAHNLDAISFDRPGSWLVFADRKGVGRGLARTMEEKGQRCIIISPGSSYCIQEGGEYQINPSHPDELRQLFEASLGPEHPPCRGLVHLWSLDIDSSAEVEEAGMNGARILGCASVLHLIQAAANKKWAEHPRLWLISRGAQPVGTLPSSLAPLQSPLWGLARVIALEHPAFQCTSLDLDPDPDCDGKQESLFLIKEIISSDRELQVAFRSGIRYAPRLIRITQTAGDGVPSPSSPHYADKKLSEAEAYRLEIVTPGSLNDLIVQRTVRRQPREGEIEIEVSAAGVNFSDVLKAMGLYPGLAEGPIPLGAECSGRIVRVGEAVNDLRIGDEVIAVAPFSFGRFVTTKRELAALKPQGMRDEEAAALPIAFLTARYALCTLGRLRAGERILIHAAAGGVGLAAIQIAQQRGAQIFATAGSPEKRAFLHSIGVQNVMDSRSLTFADEILKMTEGRGVDMVLNSLAGEAIPKSLSTLGPYGRFLEIGKTDIYKNSHLELSPFQKNLSFFAIDMDRIFRERPELAQELFKELIDDFRAGTLKPLPHQVFPLHDAVAAFRYMAQRKNIGKIVLSLKPTEATPGPHPVRSVRPDGTYLITGGLGRLGLRVAEWLSSQGARHLVLTGRGSASIETEERIRIMRDAGLQIVVAKGDVAQKEDLARVLSEINDTLPPLTGVFHAAGLLDDGILLQQEWHRFDAVMRPKVDGALNLHTLTSGMSLDFFVLFSSVASLLGSPGQGSYAAANAFMDALSHHRRSLGLPSLTINWGPWSEGMSRSTDGNHRFLLPGLNPIFPEEAFLILRTLLAGDPVQVTVLSVDWHRMLEYYKQVTEWGILVDLIPQRDVHSGAPDPKSAGIMSAGGRRREEIFLADPQKRPQLLRSYLQTVAARVLGLPASEIDPEARLNHLGLDSLMTLEIVRDIEAQLGVSLPISALIEGPSIEAISLRIQEGWTKQSEVPLKSEEKPVPSSIVAPLRFTGDLFEKAWNFKKVDELIATGLYPYFHVLDENEGPVVVVEGRKMIMAGSNNYLGLTTDHRVKEAAIKALEKYGTGCSGSRLLTGTFKLHLELEERLASFFGKEGCLLYSTGFQTAQGIIPTLVHEGEYLLSDSDNHASIVAGQMLAQAGQAMIVRYRKNDMKDLEERISQLPLAAGKLIVSDGVFSTCGTTVDLTNMVRIAKKYHARTLIDDAHALGVLGTRGRGTANHFGLDNEVDMIFGTFSKTLASLGGFVVADKPVIHYLKHHSRAMIFSASPSPASVAAALTALHILENEPERVDRLRQNARKMRNGFKAMGFQTVEGESAIVPVIIGDDKLSMIFWRKLFDAGVFVNVFVHPGVPHGFQMLRTSYMASHEDVHLNRILEVFGEIGRKLGIVH